MRWLAGLGIVAFSYFFANAALAQAVFPGEPPAAAPSPIPSPATAPDPQTATPADTPAAPIPAPPPAAPPAAGPPAAAAPRNGYVEPPPPPPRDNDLRPIRLRRPFFIGGELGWNGLSGLGVNFSYHVVPYVALDTGLGISATGLRVGGRVRTNLLTSEWTPFLGAGFSYAAGTGGQSVTSESRGEEAKYRVLGSPFAQFAAGVNYTGTEGFVFMATTGYSVLLRKENAEYVSGSMDAYQDIEAIFEGGIIVSVAFGYAF